MFFFRVFFCGERLEGFFVLFFFLVFFLVERYLRVSFVFFSCFFGGGTFSRDFLCFWFFRVFFLGGVQ